MNERIYLLIGAASIMFLVIGCLSLLANYYTLAQKYAKIISKTIINAGGENYGQNPFFYDAVEGLLTAAILLLAEYLPLAEMNAKVMDCRHIISVFKPVQDLLAPSKAKGKSQFQLLLEEFNSQTV